VLLSGSTATGNNYIWQKRPAKNGRAPPRKRLVVTETFLGGEKVPIPLLLGPIPGCVLTRIPRRIQPWRRRLAWTSSGIGAFSAEGGRAPETASDVASDGRRRRDVGLQIVRDSLPLHGHRQIILCVDM